MSKFLTIVFLAILATMTGCVFSRYRVYVYNGTASKITEAKVTLSNGELLTFGTLDPTVNKGMWPVLGPLGRESLVEWTDASEKKKSAKTVFSCGFRDDSVIYLIMSNDIVTVETGRKLYGHAKNK